MATDTHADHAHDDHGHHGPAYLAHHFDSPVQQFDAAKLGVWAFLAQEILFFSGLFVAYALYRTGHPEAFSVGSHLLNPIMGGINTCVLLISSFTAAMAVRYAQIGEQKRVTQMLVISLLCAFGFMIIKYFEYTHKFHVGFLPGKYFLCPNFSLNAAGICTVPPDPHGLAELSDAVINASKAGVGSVVDGVAVNYPYHLRSFFGIYFVMTGVHGLHVLIGIGVMVWIILRNERGEFSKDFFTPVDLVALYWHLVDLIWIYLFPLLYLID